MPNIGFLGGVFAGCSHKLATDYNLAINKFQNFCPYKPVEPFSNKYLTLLKHQKVL